MKKIFFLLLVPVVAFAQPSTPKTTTFTRQLLTNDTAAGARATLGIVSTNVSIGATNIFTTNSSNASITNQILNMVSNTPGWAAGGGSATNITTNIFTTNTSNVLITNQVRSMAIGSTNGFGTNVNLYFGVAGVGNQTNRQPYWEYISGLGFDSWQWTIPFMSGSANVISIDAKAPVGQNNIFYWGGGVIDAHSIKLRGSGDGNPNPRVTISYGEVYFWNFEENYLSSDDYTYRWLYNDHSGSFKFGASNAVLTHVDGLLVTLTNLSPVGVATNAGSDDQVLSKTGDRMKWVAQTGGVGGSATNAIASVSTNGVLIGSGVLTNLDLTNGANILISGSPNTGTGIVTIAVSPTPTFSSITTTGTGPNVLYGDQYQTNALIVTTGKLIWSNSPAGNGITNMNGNTTNSGTIAAAQFVGGGAGLSGVTATLPGYVLTNANDYAASFSQPVTFNGGWTGTDGTNSGRLHADNITVTTRLDGNTAYFGGQVDLGAGLAASNATVTVALTAGSALIGTTVDVSQTLRATNVIAGQVNYSTNSGASVAPDFDKGYTLLLTNAAFTILPPVGVSATMAPTTVFAVTNSTAAAVVITPPANVHVIGTWYVTNLSEITFHCYGGLYTNAICLPIW